MSGDIEGFERRLTKFAQLRKKEREDRNLRETERIKKENVQHAEVFRTVEEWADQFVIPRLESVARKYGYRVRAFRESKPFSYLCGINRGFIGDVDYEICFEARVLLHNEVALYVWSVQSSQLHTGTPTRVSYDSEEVRAQPEMMAEAIRSPKIQEWIEQQILECAAKIDDLIES